MTLPLEFFLFGATLLGIALFDRQATWVAVTGLVLIAAYKVLFTGFSGEPGIRGLGWLLDEEWVLLANLLLLLLGFAMLARHVQASGLPEVLPRALPDDWTAGAALLALVFVMSAFLDNIAAAMIGATIAASVFRGKVHVGFLAAIVAASNAGGSGSVLGDTTTTMMWLAGKSPLSVLHAYVAAAIALVVFAIPASRQQHAYSPVVRDAAPRAAVDVPRIVIVAATLLAAIAANIYASRLPDEQGEAFPYLGATVAGVLLFLTPWRRPDWKAAPAAIKGAVFLLSLVLAAAMMPVDRLPPASIASTFVLGFLSAVFDNIPLTKLALAQGGYDWGLLAYAVGFGGSMLWFGSSAGVAVANLFPEAKSAALWLRHGWHVALGYVVGFAALLLILGWRAN
jgi:Na+/H+ antiporter NhaD/arsenite permease-like protein